MFLVRCIFHKCERKVGGGFIRNPLENCEVRTFWEDAFGSETQFRNLNPAASADHVTETS